VALQEGKTKMLRIVCQKVREVFVQYGEKAQDIVREDRVGDTKYGGGSGAAGGIRPGKSGRNGKKTAFQRADSVKKSEKRCIKNDKKQWLCEK